MEKPKNHFIMLQYIILYNVYDKYVITYDIVIYQW
jgi:hypothetical protein